MKKAILLGILFFLTCTIAGIAEIKPSYLNSDNSQFFIENKGQWDPQVKFLARMGGLNYWITNTGATYDYYHLVIEEPVIESSNPNNEDPTSREPKIKERWGHVIKNTLIGMNSNFLAMPEGRKEGVYNYYLGNDESKWASNVHLFSSFKLQNIYNGIDMVYYYNDNEVRYDFVVTPNSNPNQIIMKFEGQYSVKVSSNGDLVFSTSVGEVSHSKLFAYQEINGVQNKIECKFIDKGDGLFGFDLSSYDASKPLIIDPTVNYVTYFGRSSSDYANANAIDNSGNAIQAGYTYSSDLPTTPGAYQTSRPYSYCGYVVKFNSIGNGLIFCTYLGGTSSYSYVYGCGSDQNGYTYAAGYTGATNFPTTSGAFQTSYSGTPDGFVSKFNSTGGIVYSTYFGGSSTDYIYGMYVDQSGYVYLTGATYSTNFPVSAGAFKTSLVSSPDAFCSKLNLTGTGLVLSTYLGGSSSDYGYAITADQYGYPYVTGYTLSSNYPVTSGAYYPYYTYYDPYITKVSLTGQTLIYSTYIPSSSSSDYAYAIAVNPAGEAAITGYANSSNFPITPGAFQTTFYGTDAFVLKMNANGNGLIFSTFLGYTGSDYGRGIAYDASGNIIVGGYTSSTSFPGVTSDGYRTYNSGSYDAFLTVFSGSGSRIYGTYIGGSSSDYASNNYQAVGINQSNEVVIGGYTNSTNFPTTPGAYQTYYYSTPDSWIAKFTFDPPVKLTTTNVNATQFCKGDFLNVDFTLDQGKIKVDNYFKVQLSDENGSFASPREIGSIFSTTPATISCQLPSSNLPPSTFYKVRVISTSPASVGTECPTTITVMPQPIVFNVVGDAGFCANAKFGAEIGLDDTEKYNLYQLYCNGSKVGNPLVGTDQKISFGRFKTVGIYTVESTTPFGCKTMMNGSVENIMIPLPTTYNMTGGSQFYNIPGPGTYCEGSDGVAIGLSQGDPGINYQLQFNGSDIGVPVEGLGDAISFGYFTQEGTYTIKAVSQRGGCESIMNGNISVKMLPAPTIFDLISTGNYCEGSNGAEIKLSNSEAGFYYQLFFNGVALGKQITGTGSILNFGVFNKPGVYKVLATNPSTSCTNLMKGEVNLTPIPSPKVYDLSGNGHYCTGTEGAIISISNSDVNAIYELYNNNLPTGIKLVGTGSPLVFDPILEEGTYTIIASSILANCTTKMNGNVLISKIPLPDVTIVGNKTPAMNSEEKYSINQPQENETYLWKVTNGEIIGSKTTAQITVKWADHKIGTVELYRKNGWGCSNWAINNIDLKNILSADFSAKQTKGDAPFVVEFTNNSSGFISSYQWDFGDGLSSYLSNPIHTYKKAGTYSVKLTVSHEGDSQISTKEGFITVYPPNSVQEDGQSYNSNGTVGISLIEPNPAKNEIHFNYTLTYDQNIEIAVYDALGNKLINVLNEFEIKGTHNLNVNISNLVSGSYYLQMSSNDGNVTKQFTVKR